MSAEEWLPVVGWEGVYEVSDLGRVRRVRRGRGTRGGVIRGSLDSSGYPVADLCDRGRRHNAKVHRLVTEAFIGPLPDGLETRHLNGDPSDARLVNLAYGTHAENMRDMVEHGRSRLSVTHCPRGHEYAGENLWIDHRGARNCRTCTRARGRVQARLILQRKKERGELYFFNVRQWARANGIAIKETGRISNEVLNAYREATRQEQAA